MVTKKIDYWLSEEELKTPIHDEMVLWTFNNCISIIEELRLCNLVDRFVFRKEGISWDWDKKQVIFDEKYSQDEYYLKYLLEARDSINEDFEEFNKLKVYNKINKIMEYPLKGYNGFILGFVDLLVKLNFRDTECFCTSIRDEKGYVQEEYNFAFEIKPNVKSIGDVLRQFQYYKQSLGDNTKLILVTKTKGLKEIFESQGFFVVEYEDVKEVKE